MKVYFTPIKITANSSRLSLLNFFDNLVKNYQGQSDFHSVDKEIKFKFFEDPDCFIVVVLTTKDLGNFCEGDDSGADFEWKMSGSLLNKMAETNILLISKKNYAGAYLHNEGSVRINTFETKLRWLFRQTLRDRYQKSKRDEKFSILRLVDSDDIIKKVSRLSSIDEINATFLNTSTIMRSNGSIYKDAKTVRITQRMDGFSLKTLTKKQEISDYLEDLVKKGCSGISIKGTGPKSIAGETIGIADAVNSIHSMEYSEYIAELNGKKLSQLLGSSFFTAVKTMIMSNPLVKKA